MGATCLEAQELASLSVGQTLENRNCNLIYFGLDENRPIPEEILTFLNGKELYLGLEILLEGESFVLVGLDATQGALEGGSSQYENFKRDMGVGPVLMEGDRITEDTKVQGITLLSIQDWNKLKESV